MLSAEEEDARQHDEERFKFDLYTRRPDLYDDVYGEAAYDRAEEEGEMIVPSGEEEVQELLAEMRKLEEASRGR